MTAALASLVPRAPYAPSPTSPAPRGIVFRRAMRSRPGTSSANVAGEAAAAASSAGVEIVIATVPARRVGFTTPVVSSGGALEAEARSALLTSEGTGLVPKLRWRHEKECVSAEPEEAKSMVREKGQARRGEPWVCHEEKEDCGLEERGGEVFDLSQLACSQ